MVDMNQLPPIIQVGDVLLSSEILTEKFCCDLSACKGQCCVEGDAGAPVTLEEIAEIEDCLDEVWGDLSASAQAVIDKQGVAYTDKEGDLVTSIVRGKDCVFTYYDNIDDFETIGKRPHRTELQPLGGLQDGCCQGRTGKHPPLPIPARTINSPLWRRMVRRIAQYRQGTEGTRVSIVFTKFLQASSDQP